MDVPTAEFRSRRVDLMVAAGIALLAFVLQSLWLLVGHPFEDAYILFTYVENAVAGHGVVYHPAGPPAEGFTDTVWFVALVGLRGLGLDVGFAAAVVTAVSVGVMGRIALAAAPAGVAARLAVAVWLLLFHGTLASLGGFGCLFFCAVLAGAWWAVWRRNLRSQWFLLALLPLVRLEGWAAAGGLWLVVCTQHRSAPRIWGWSALAMLGPLGLLTLVRWFYFGALLPLPALVKGGGEEWLPGLESNLNWLVREVGPLPWLVVLSVLVIWLRPARRKEAWWATVPALCVLVPLLLAEQMQNVRWRFQAPATLGIVLATLTMAREAWTSASPRARVGLTILLCVACLPTWLIGGKQLARALRDPPQLFSHGLTRDLAQSLDPSRVLATTEAGILAFRQRCRVVDLVGLNTATFARRLVRPEDLDRLAPDLLVCNTYGVLDLREQWGEVGAGLAGTDSDSVALRREDLLRRRRLPGRVRLRTVAGVCFDFLARHPEYQVRAVREGRNVLVYATKPSLAADPRFVDAWNRAHAAPAQQGYLDSWPRHP